MVALYSVVGPDHLDPCVAAGRRKGRGRGHGHGPDRGHGRAADLSRNPSAAGLPCHGPSPGHPFGSSSGLRAHGHGNHGWTNKCPLRRVVKILKNRIEAIASACVHLGRDPDRGPDLSARPSVGCSQRTAMFATPENQSRT